MYINLSAIVLSLQIPDFSITKFLFIQNHSLFNYLSIYLYLFPVWLRNRLIPARLEPYWKNMHSIVLQTIFYKYLKKTIKLILFFLARAFWPLVDNKTSFNLTIFHINICGKVSRIRCCICIHSDCGVVLNKIKSSVALICSDRINSF